MSSSILSSHNAVWYTAEKLGRRVWIIQNAQNPPCQADRHVLRRYMGKKLNFSKGIAVGHF
jgi:hypothetical protein